MTPEELARRQDWRNRLKCVSRDPCAYDNTCENHKLLGEVTDALAERDREIAFLTEDRADAWKRLSEEEKNSQALRAQRDALVAAIENWRKVAIRILDGETEAASEFEDAGIVLDTALAVGRGEG